jgi:Ala-tRNA(Pro) deacylase
MSCAQRLREFLDSHASTYVLIKHARAFTAQEIAASVHVPGREMAKTVVVRTEQGLALVVLRAQDHVNLGRVGRELGGSAVLASESEFGIAFPDCEVGAMPPFGKLYQLPTLVDREITKDEEIVFNAGTHTDVLRMRYEDYARLVKPRVLDLTMRTAQLVG